MMPESTVLSKRAAITWGGLFSILGLLLILYTTLFPFDILFSHQHPNFAFNLIEPNMVIDYSRNILLFIPFSFGLTHLLSQRTKILRQIVIATVILIGACLSTTVEILQLFIVGRDPSLADILNNTIGTVCGLLIFYWGGKKLLSYLSRLSVKLLAVIVIVYYLVFAFAFLSLSKATGLDNWDPTFPLILGNELSGDRPWQGTISNLQIADYPFSAQEIEQVFDGETVDSLIAFYPLNSVTSLADQTHQQPDLIWHDSPPAANQETGVELDAKHWLLSRTPATDLSRRLASSSQFTLSALVTTANQYQTGPARIVSLSTDVFHRNLTIGQDGTDLIIRLRTPATGDDGSQPELDVPDVFADNQPHQLIIIYDGLTLNTYIDSFDRFYSFKLIPHITIFRYLSPLIDWRIRLSSNFLLAYRAFYYALIFIPLGFLLCYLYQNNKSKSHESGPARTGRLF